MQRNINTTEDQMFTGEMSEFGMMEFSDPRAQAIFKNCEDNYKRMLELKRAYDNQELLRKMRADLKREYMTRKKQVKQLQLVAAVDFRNAHHLFEQHHRMNTFGEFKFGVRGVDISAPVVSQIQLPNGETVDLKTFNKDLEFDKVCQIHKMIQDNLEVNTDDDDDGNDTPPCLYRRDNDTPPCLHRRATRAAFGGCYDFYNEEEEQHQEPEEQPEQEEHEEPEQQQEEHEEPEQPQEEPEQQEEPDEDDDNHDNHVSTSVCVDHRLERAGNSTKAKKPAASAKAKKSAILVKKQKFVPFQIETNVNHTSNWEMLPSKIEIDMPKKNLHSREDKKRHNQKLKRIRTEN
jgi:flagellar biosynthesis GTPase FlhF